MASISLKCKLKVFSDLLWMCTFPWACGITFYFSLSMWFLLNVPIFSIWLPKEEKEKNERGRGGRALEILSKSLHPEREGLATMSGGTATMAIYPFVCTSVIRSSNQQWEYRSPIFGRQCAFCSLWLPKVVCRLLQEHLHSCLLYG